MSSPARPVSPWRAPKWAGGGRRCVFLTCLGLGFLAPRSGLRQAGARALGEEFLLFGRKPDLAADPPADILGGERGDAHRCSPQGDGNTAGHLNRTLVLSDGDRGRGRRNKGALVLGNNDARLPGEFFLADVR